VLCLAALSSLIWQTAAGNPSHLWLLVGMIGLSFFIEGAFRVLTGREFRPAGIRPENR